MIKHNELDSQGMTSTRPAMARRGPGLFLVLLLIQLAWPMTARAALVQGFVKDEAGIGAAQVQVDFVETVTGVTTNATSNSLGFYFVDVIAGSYDLRYLPPAGGGLVALKSAGLVVTAAATLSDVLLRFGVVVTGTVVDNLGAPVVGADLNLVDQATLTTAYTPGDNTDASGHYLVTVRPGVYDINYRPPTSTLLAPKQLPAVNLMSNTVIPTVVVMPGVTLTGSVVDSVGGPVFDVNLAFFDSFTRQFVYSTQDHTDATGTYSVIVEPGTYNIQFIPPVGTLLAGQRLSAVAVPADLTLPDVVLPAGIEVSGNVIDGNGVGIADVNLNFFDAATGLGRFTPRDNSAADGSYLIVLPPGIYNIQYVPLPGGRLVPVRLADVALPASTSLPDVVLVSGQLVSGNVLDAVAAPVLGVDLNFFDSATGVKLFTANDNTDAAGHYDVAVPVGTYTIEYTPSVGTQFLPVKLLNVGVAGDLVLPDLHLMTGLALSATVVDGGGQPVPGVDIDVLDAATLVGIFVVHDTSDAAGFFRMIVPPGDYVVQLQPPTATGFLPSRTAAIAFTVDTDLGPLSLQSGFRVNGAVVNGGGLPVADVDLDFVDQATGVGQLLVGDSTDTAGLFQVAVSGGTYLVQYEPLASTHLVSQEVAAVAVSADTTLPLMTLHTGTLVSGSVVNASRIPVGGVDTDWFVAGTCQQVFTARDFTDPSGQFQVALDSGSYDINFNPPFGSGLFMARATGVAVGTTDMNLGTQALNSAPVETEVCDGIDNDCDGLVDEGCALPQVALDVEASLLTWLPVPGAASYDVIRGDLGVLRGTAGDFQVAAVACEANDQLTTMLVAALSPPSPGGYWFLVRAVDAAGPDSWGDPARDAGIGASASTCP